MPTLNAADIDSWEMPSFAAPEFYLVKKHLNTAWDCGGHQGSWWKLFLLTPKRFHKNREGHSAAFKYVTGASYGIEGMSKSRDPHTCL